MCTELLPCVTFVELLYLRTMCRWQFSCAPFQ
nr:MAG TPA: hypothetical protein [Caudoviricetes sp.]